jgi:polyphosphate kinase
MCRDASLFFNAITGYSEVQPGRRLVMAPFHLKDKVISLIEREAARKTQEYPGLIMAKMNSLTDPDVIQALYRASKAGVTVWLNVRGICMLVPGLPGLSENIRVVSVVDRYLEHARIFYFANGGASDVYLSSADWMERNLEKRVELLFPLLRDDCRSRVVEILRAYFKDTLKSSQLKSDGSWARTELEAGGQPFRVQEHFHLQAMNRAEARAREPKLQLEVRRGQGREAE